MIDEPTEGLAPMVVEQVANFLGAVRARGIPILLVEQKLAIALDISERVCITPGRRWSSGISRGAEGPRQCAGVAGSLMETDRVERRRVPPATRHAAGSPHHDRQPAGEQVSHRCAAMRRDRSGAGRSPVGVVLAGAGSSSRAGRHREFNTPRMPKRPTLHTLITAFESSTKPTVAALHGSTMGAARAPPRLPFPRGRPARSLPGELGLLPARAAHACRGRSDGSRAQHDRVRCAVPRKSLPRGTLRQDRRETSSAPSRSQRSSRRSAPSGCANPRSSTPIPSYLAFFGTAGAMSRAIRPLKCIEAVAASVDKTSPRARIERASSCAHERARVSSAAPRILRQRAAARIPASRTHHGGKSRAWRDQRGHDGRQHAMGLNAGIPVTYR